jgi:hypothetical protein
MLVIFSFPCNFAQNKYHDNHKNQLQVKSACDLLANVNENLNYICNNARSLVDSSQNSCMIILLDSLKSISIRTSNIKAYVALDSLASYSFISPSTEAFPSDVFETIIPELFYSNFNDFITYLYNNPKSHLRKILIDGLGAKSSLTGKFNDYIKNEAFIDEKIREKNYPKALSSYILKIKTGIKNSKYRLNNLFVCDILNNVKDNLSFICVNAAPIIRSSQEDCTLLLIDSLVNYANYSNDTKSLIALDSLAKYSDGYISEAFDDKVTEIFYNNFNGLIKHLFNNPKNHLREYLIAGLSMDVNMSENKQKEKRDIESYINKQLSETNYSKAQQNFIKKIVKDIKPKMWD